MNARIKRVELRLKIALERLTGYRVHLFEKRRHGHEAFVDITVSNYPIKTIFDVGANVGQSAVLYTLVFPEAQVYCFEPVSTTYAELTSNMERNANVECHRLALGAADGQSKIFLRKDSSTNSLIQPRDSFGQETINITTLDKFLDEKDIGGIDLLKIDTEGSDLEVLKGARETLSSGKVAFVQVEVGFHPSDKRFVLFDDAREFLISHGYSVFGIYDQTQEWTGEKRLRWANVLFFREPPFEGGE